MLQGHLQQARDAYTRAIELDPELAWTYGNRGHVLSRLGLHSEALRDYDRAFKLAPDDINTAWTFLWTRMISFGPERREEMVGELLRIAQIDPEHYITPLCLGVAALLRTDLAGALAHFEEAVKKEPGQWDPHSGSGLRQQCRERWKLDGRKSTLQ